MIEYKIRIDLQSDRTLFTDICLTSGDVRAYRLSFSFYDLQQRYDVSNHVLAIKAKRPDGVIITDKGEIMPDGRAIYDIKSNIYAVPGHVSMEVALSSPDGSYITTKEILLVVRKGYGDGDITAGDTAPILVKLLTEATRAESAASKAEQIASEIEKFIGMEVSAQTLDTGCEATAKVVDDGEVITLQLGLPKGDSGYSPVLGVDYFTQEDKAMMVAEVLAALPNGDEVSY